MRPGRASQESPRSSSSHSSLGVPQVKLRRARRSPRPSRRSPAAKHRTANVQARQHQRLCASGSTPIGSSRPRP
eukprot:527676-Lingulodinium_polyedra.AAC.1